MGFGDMRIGTRLKISFVVMLLLIIVVGASGFIGLKQVDDEVKTSVESASIKKSAISAWILGASVNASNTIAYLRSSEGDDRVYFKDVLDKQTNTATDIVQKIQDGIVPKSEEEQLFNQISDARQRYVTLRAKMIELLQAGDKATLTNLLNKEFTPATTEYLQRIQNFSQYYDDKVTSSIILVGDRYQASTIVIAVVSAIGVILGIVISVVLSQSITAPLGRAVQMAEAVAKGDLRDEDIGRLRRDETGMLLASLKRMRENLNLTVSKIRTGAESISTSATEVATGNLDLSSRTEQQASSLEETASSMEELTSTVRQNADNASQAHVLAIQAADSAKKGQNVITNVMTTMQDITASSNKMEDIINVIDGIAFQTNILALNAAVEAARAGEQGRGFAVVATEVRNLAQRSASAAKEIKALIDTSVLQIRQGSGLVAEAGNAMTEIAQGSQRSTDVIAEISASSKEQSAGIEQVSQAVMQLDQVTQQNAALVEQSAAASDSMKMQAQRLVEAVSTFVISANDLGLTLDQVNTDKRLMKDVTEKPLALT